MGVQGGALTGYTDNRNPCNRAASGRVGPSEIIQVFIILVRVVFHTSSVVLFNKTNLKMENLSEILIGIHSFTSNCTSQFDSTPLLNDI